MLEDMIETLRQLYQFDKYEYPIEYGELADKWNTLYSENPELGKRVLKEYGQQ